MLLATSFTMVFQDFSADPDEMRLRTAAHLMVSSLAGSLALVTCKEPLRLSIANQLRVLLTTILPPDQQLLENAVQQLTSTSCRTPHGWCTHRHTHMWCFITL